MFVLKYDIAEVGMNSSPQRLHPGEEILGLEEIFIWSTFLSKAICTSWTNTETGMQKSIGISRFSEFYNTVLGSKNAF